MLMLAGITASMPGGEAVAPGHEFDSAATSPAFRRTLGTSPEKWMDVQKKREKKMTHQDRYTPCFDLLRSSSRAGDEIEDFCSGLGGVGVYMKGRKATARLGG
jgi:hypothetical protein